MFILTERIATLGEKYSGSKNEKFTFEINGIPLDEQEVNAFFGHPQAYRRLHHLKTVYEVGDTGNELEPFLPGIKSLEIKKPIEGAFIQLRYGLSNARIMKFTDCTLSKIEIALYGGGETSMGFKVTAPPVLNETLTELIAMFGRPVTVEVRSYPPDAQKEMPLNQHGEGEQPTEAREGQRPSSIHQQEDPLMLCKHNPNYVCLSEGKCDSRAVRRRCRSHSGSAARDAVGNSGRARRR